MDRKPVVEANLLDISVTYSTRPGSDSSILDVTLDSIELHDRCTVDTAFGVLLVPSGGKHSSKLISKHGGSFFRLSLETNPYQAPEASAILSLDMLPLDIVLNRPILDRIAAVFESPENEAEQPPPAFIQELQEAAKKQVQELTDATVASMESALRNRQQFLLKVNAFAPNLILPEDIQDPNGQLLVAKLGLFSINSMEEQREGKGAVERHYDNYRVSVSSLQLSFYQDDGREVPLVSPFDLSVNLQVASKHSSRIRIYADLSTFSLRLSAPQLSKAGEMVLSLLPASTSTSEKGEIASSPAKTDRKRVQTKSDDWRIDATFSLQRSEVMLESDVGDAFFETVLEKIVVGARYFVFQPLSRLL